MTVLSARQVAGYWVGARGPEARVVEWVAIAIGESSLDDSAVSSAGAIGLWQIMPEHAPEYGFSVAQLFDPSVNAYIAVRLSGYGINCAAWDSCYADIYASGRYSFLAFPERGSADYNNLATAANELGKNKNYVIGVTPEPSMGQGSGPALAKISEIEHQILPSIARTITWETIKVSRMYRKGWRP